MSDQPNSLVNPLIGTWTYRSFLNDPNLDTPFDNLEF